MTWATPEGVRAALQPDTDLVLLETPANPTFALVDLDDVVEQAGKVPVLVDDTFATPVLQNPARHGVTLILHSATKLLGGHGDVRAGAVPTTAEWAAELRKIRVLTGNVLHPLAGRLQRHRKVARVFYPGLSCVADAPILRKQMRGTEAILAFTVAGGFEAASRVKASVELMTPAVSLGSVDTLIQHPAGLTHRVVEESARRSAGVSDSLLRLSVGLEDPEDLWADLEQALERS